jgi:PAS domain S-box-containing protein
MFDNYDIAWAKYQKKLRILPLPILSWDIFSHPNVEITAFNSLQKNWVNKEDYYNQIANKSVIVTDSKLTIIFATKEISELTGYRSSEIIGQTPKMFQGALTDDRTREKIRTAISKNHPFKEIVINYKKDGTCYKCEIEAYPKFDTNNNIVNYIAFERIAS